jgi:hypothetical protein
MLKLPVPTAPQSRSQRATYISAPRAASMPPRSTIDSVGRRRVRVRDGERGRPPDREVERVGDVDQHLPDEVVGPGGLERRERVTPEVQLKTSSPNAAASAKVTSPH